MARSNVFSAATWRRLTCRSPLRRAFAEGSDGRTSATTTSTTQQHRHDGDARRDRELEQRVGRFSGMRGRPGTLMCRQSASSAMLTSSDVMPKLTNGNVTPVSGSTARLPATVTASWHSASTTQVTREPAQERLIVVHDAALRGDEARLAARDAAVVPDQPVQPHARSRASSPRRTSSRTRPPAR